jgi:hypothetical protein
MNLLFEVAFIRASLLSALVRRMAATEQMKAKENTQTVEPDGDFR